MPRPNTITTHPELEAIKTMLGTDTIANTAKHFGVSEDALSRFKAKELGQTQTDELPDEPPSLEQPRRISFGYTHPRDPETLEPLIKAARAEERRTSNALEDIQNEPEKAQETARQAARSAPSDLDELERLESRIRAAHRAVEAAEQNHDDAKLALSDLENEVKAWHRDKAIWENAKEFMVCIETYDHERDTLLSTVATARSVLMDSREAAIKKHHKAMGMGLPSSDPVVMRSLLLEHGINGRTLDLLMIEATQFRQYEQNHPILKVREDLNKVFFEGKF